jgi:hypothetical protein
MRLAPNFVGLLAAKAGEMQQQQVTNKSMTGAWFESAVNQMNGLNDRFRECLKR